MSASTTRIPTFNHVAMSVPSDLLEPAGRRELLEFYGEVFGWTEMPTMSEDGKRLVLRVHSNEQFVFLVSDDKPMTCPAGDHFGMSVGSPHELYTLLERARQYARRDARVEIIETETEDFEVLKLHSFYVRYQLPMMVEVQCFDWAAGLGADSLPDGADKAGTSKESIKRGRRD